MRRFVMITAALALAFSAPAFAQKLDKNGRCHDAAGRFAKMAVCESGPDAHAAPSGALYKLDAKGMCHDAKGKMAKKDMCAGMKKS